MQSIAARWRVPVVIKSTTFDRWLKGIRDIRGRARILTRIERLAAGNAGDVKPIGEGLSEMQIDSGPGYRVYFMMRGDRFVLLLAGGDKSTQRTDIIKAKSIAAEWE